MMGPLRVNDAVVVPETELEWRFSRSSGPGGQGVNTTDSRVELSLDVSATTALSESLRDRAVARLAGRLLDGRITVAASEHRSQLRNREAAAERLAQVLREAIAPPPKKRRPTKPSKRAKQRRLDEKKHRGKIKKLRRGEDLAAGGFAGSQYHADLVEAWRLADESFVVGPGTARSAGRRLSGGGWVFGHARR